MFDYQSQRNKIGAMPKKHLMEDNEDILP